ncbi:hypothetical protein PR048_011425 [Dryococelus australis]|uniref:Uncharacterized protein n=1 Tax=Dryococelus australis TaxID=614101 RepID=A0ABQ9HLK6_9NEOP|nr:hypothetical protein PR048_011425 [Dryococelus australis]
MEEQVVQNLHALLRLIIWDYEPPVPPAPQNAPPAPHPAPFPPTPAPHPPPALVVQNRHTLPRTTICYRKIEDIDPAMGPRLCSGRTIRRTLTQVGELFSGISYYSRPFIPVLPHTHFASTSSALKNYMSRAAQIYPFHLIQLLRLPMRAIGVGPGGRSMETGDCRKYPPTSGIVQHDSHMRGTGVARPGIGPSSSWWEASRLTAQPPWAPTDACLFQFFCIIMFVSAEVSRLCSHSDNTYIRSNTCKLNIPEAISVIKCPAVVLPRANEEHCLFFREVGNGIQQWYQHPSHGKYVAQFLMLASILNSHHFSSAASNHPHKDEDDLHNIPLTL